MKKPMFDVSVKVTHLNSESWIQVGRAWKESDGKISIRLLTLPFRDSSWDGSIMLFPVKGKEE